MNKEFLQKETGEVASKKIHHHRFYLHDVLQVIVGASILAVPVGFTEEAWKLGEALPFFNILALFVISLIFISAFTYYHYHQKFFRRHWPHFIKRVFSTYLISFFVVALLLTIIQATPWQTNVIVALKRIVIVSFPCSMSAAVADTIKVR